MNKKWLKFSLYILIILTTVVLTSTVVLGYNYTDFGGSGGGTNGSEQVLDLSATFFAIAKTAGYVLGVLLILIIAIQFMTSSPQKKAELKTRAWMYTIGIVLLITIPTMMDWAGEWGASLSNGGGSSGSGSAGTDLQSHIEQNSSGANGIEGFWSLFKGKSGSSSSTSSSSSSSSSNSSSSSGSSNSSNSSDPLVQGGNTQNQSSTSNQNTGYISTSASKPEDLQEGDRIYFQVDGNGNINGGNWNDSSKYYVLGPNERVYSVRGEYWLGVENQWRRPLGQMGGIVNGFQGSRTAFDNGHESLNSDAI